MRNVRALTLLTTILLFLLPAAITAQQPTGVDNPPLPVEEPVREILIPFEDLNVILASNVERVFMTRVEYKELLDRASQRPGARPPQDVALVSGRHQVDVGEGRATITSVFQVDVLDDGLQALPLALSEVAVQLALLDDKPASLVQDPQQGVLLLVEGKGSHTLKLELLAPMQISAAQQTLQGILPHAAAGQFLLNVPGNVEIKSGARVLSRSYDEQANVTSFELLSPSTRMTIVMSLNNRRLRDNRMLLARGVIVDELTESYERIHATVALQVLQGAVDQLTVQLPGDFEVTRVNSPTLARWSVQANDDGTQQLTAQLRDFIEDGTVVTITANRLAPEWDSWQFPQLLVHDVVSQTSVLGVLAERRLVLEDLQATNLVSLNNDVLGTALPASIFETDPGAPPIQLLATFYAAQSDYQLAADIALPARSLNATGNVLLTVAESGQYARGGLVLLPDVEDVFQFQFSIPDGWQVTDLTDQDGTILQRDETSRDGERRMRVKLTNSIPAGSSREIYFVARHVPSGWLGNWESQTIQFPRFRVLGTDRQIGAIAVHVQDDLEVRPAEVTGLTALGNREKGDFGLAELDTRMAYYFDTTDYALSLDVTRTDALVTARSQSFFKVSEGAIETNYELTFDIQKSSLDRLEFSLPIETPTSLQIFGLEGCNVKQQSSRDQDGRRYWTVLLHDRIRGRATLGIHTQLPLGDIDAGDELVRQLPMVRAESVSYQSGVVAVEGSIDLDVKVNSAARQVDVGELISLNYTVGNRLLGGYGFVDKAPLIELNILRHPEHDIPAVMVSQAELVTFLSASGESQSVAHYTINSKVSYLQIALPAESEAWAIFVGNHPVRPQQRGDRILISLVNSESAGWSDLRVVYSTPVGRLGLSGTIRGQAPRLYEGSGNSDQEVRIANLDWKVILPDNYRATRIRGSLVRVDHQPKQLSDSTSMTELLGVLSQMTDVIPLGSSSRGYELTSSARQDGVMMPQSASDGRMMDERSGFENQLADSRDADFDTTEEMTTEGAMPSDDQLPQPPAAASPGEPAQNKPEDESVAPPTSPDPFAEPGDAEGGSSDSPASTARESGASGYADMQGESAEGGDKSSSEYLSAFGKPSTRLWGMQGKRSLIFDFSAGAANVSPDRLVHLTSLGEGGEWQVTVVHQQHSRLIAGFLTLLFLLVGLGLSRAAARVRYRYICGLLTVGIVVPLLGFFPALGQTWDNMFVVGLLLIPLYLVIPMFWWGCNHAWQSLRKRSAVAGLSLLLMISQAGQMLAQQPFPVDADEPVRVTVPADAIIVPYDPDKLGEAALSDRVLIPYQRYADLWKRAYPNRPLLDEILPSTYAFASSQFRATLLDGDFLLLTGYLDVDVFSDQEVGIPLVLSGGVLRTAMIDGKPARLQVLAPGQQLEQQVQQTQQAANTPAQAAAGAVSPSFRLLLKGQGRTRLEMTIAMPVTRQGGWHIIQGVLPVAPASRLTLQVPATRTELRWSGTTDRGEQVSAADNEVVNLSPDPHGNVQFRWRPTVAESMVDRSLTARSTVLVDVQEEAVHSVWNVALQFRRGQRDIFQFQLPVDYQVERVKGDNVRGWDVKIEDQQQSLTVELLEAARGQTLLELHLVRHGTVGQGNFSQFDLPVVVIPDAILHQGVVAIRRTSLMTLRTVTLTAVTREDLTREAAAVFQAREAARLSPLGLQPFQVYQFADTPFHVRLAAELLPDETNVDLQTLVRVAERDLEVESQLRVKPGRRAVHRLDVQVPANLELDEVQAPGIVDWSLSELEQDQVSSTLTILLESGRRQAFDVVLRGSVPRGAEDEGMQLPQIIVQRVLDQYGTIVVQTDPSYDVEILQLVNCQEQPLRAADGWLKTGRQRTLARLVLAYRTADYAASVKLVRRQAKITASSISNIRVTDRAIEETILLEFLIQDAGIDELRFQLPAAMADARISAGLMRQLVMEPVDAAQPEGLQQVTLSLQDEVIGQFKVLIEHDKVLDDSKLQSAPIPLIQTGQTSVRYVTVDSTGDEVKIDSHAGLEEMAPQSTAYQSLVNRIGGAIGKAYSTTGQAARLEYQITQRAVREVISARISLSNITIVMDEQGAYRARQEYEMDNRVEQFLDVRLPANAKLWVVQVGGLAVKPRMVDGQNDDPRLVRIPIQRLAEGDAEFKVVFYYGGTTSTLSSWGKISFPFVQMKSNVNIEKTHIALHLPAGHHWYGFDGTAVKVESSDDLQTEVLQGKRDMNYQIARTTVKGKDAYALSRFRNNLKQQRIEYGQLSSQQRDLGDVQQNIEQSLQLLDEVESRLVELETENEKQARGNRYFLNQGFAEQDNDVARNSVQMLGDNFSLSADQPATDPATEGRGRFEKNWFAFNGLVLPEAEGKSDDFKSRVANNEPGGRNKRPMARRPMSKPMGGKLPQAAETPAPANQSGGENVQMAPGRESQLHRYQRKLEADFEDVEEDFNRRSQQLAQGQNSAPLGKEGDLSGPDTRSMDRLQSGNMLSGGMGGMGGGGGGGGGMGGMGGGTSQYSADGVMTDGLAQQLNVTGIVDAAGLASLDEFDLPLRGDVYLFKTIGGTVELEARHIDETLMSQSSRLLWLAGSLLGLLLIVQIGGPLARHRIMGFVLATVLFLYSALLLATSSVGIIGIPLMAISIIWVFWLLHANKPADNAVQSAG